MNDGSQILTDFIAVIASLGVIGLGVFCYQQSIQIEALQKINESQSLRLETMEKTLLMSR